MNCCAKLPWSKRKRSVGVEPEENGQKVNKNEENSPELLNGTEVHERNPIDLIGQAVSDPKGFVGKILDDPRLLGKTVDTVAKFVPQLQDFCRGRYKLKGRTFKRGDNPYRTTFKTDILSVSESV
ncbi:unnamed protein product [Cyprideis torosa]|uniref:Uncharacterized protein n=1 Tax=Cyprideis torosa TaxID=163714 RepID=A0A7R8WIC7_9CRUS|nr:unnamed protein product [Cyprideis torosa]CAG0893964.1 unnamed protein product [Cyprideis torosa]